MSILNFLKAILSGRSRLTNTEYHKMAQAVKFEYFHNVWDNRKITQLSDMLPDNDERLLYCATPSRHLNREIEFDHDGSFVRGCVRIRKNSDTENC
jgi:hypothetical protein